MPRAKAPALRTLELTRRNGIGIVALNRPEVHNAIDDVMIGELTEVLRELAADDRVRIMLLTGNGPSFCAGADLAWMKKSADAGRAKNVEGASRLAAMLKALNELPKPTMARVHGAVRGGGVG